MTNNDDNRPWSRLRREAGAVVWSSFLAASGATMVCFAFLDPLLLSHDDAPPAWLTSRMSGYAMGFFFFWGVAAIAAVLAVCLLDRHDIETK